MLLSTIKINCNKNEPVKQINKCLLLIFNGLKIVTRERKFNSLLEE